MGEVAVFPSGLLSDEIARLAVRSLALEVKAIELHLFLFREKSLKIPSCLNGFYDVGFFFLLFGYGCKLYLILI